MSSPDFKIANFSTLLPYFGNCSQSKDLAFSLCKGTREFGDQFPEIFEPTIHQQFLSPFDKDLIDEKAVILEDDYTVSTVGPDTKHSTVRTIDPVPMHDFPVYLTFKLIAFKKGYITVGLVEKDHDLKTYVGKDKKGWGFDVCGALYH